MEVSSEKTEYTIGEALDISAVTVTGIYENGYRAPIDAEDCTFTAEMISLGEKEVSVSYTPVDGETVTASFDIEIVRGSYNGLVEYIPATPGEAKFLTEDESTGYMGDGTAEDPFHRYTDQTDYFVYCIDAGVPVEKALLALDLGGQFRIDYSVDGTDWTLVQERAEFAQHAAMLFPLPTLGENDGKIYIRFKDSTEGDGMGADLYSFAYYYEADAVDLPEAVGDLESLRVELTKTSFELNESIADDMITVYAVYTGVIERPVSLADCTVTRPDMSTPGTKTLQVSWQGATGSVALEVGIGTLKGIEVSGPTKTVYEIGEPLDLAGLVVEAVYSTDYRQTLEDGAYTVSAADMYAPGEKTITVSYTPQGGAAVTGTFTVTVVRGNYNGYVGFEALTETEGTYLARNYLSDQWDGYRSMDGDKPHDYTDLGAYLVYGFDGGASWTGGLLFLDISGHYQVTISLDGETFAPLLRSDGSAARAVERIDLGSYLAGNTGKVWLRISDGDNTDGFGACLYGLDIYYTDGEEEETPAAAPLPMPSVSVIPDNNTEWKYLVDDNGSSPWGLGSPEDPFHRSADGTASFTYLFTAEGKYNLATLSLTIKGHFKIEVSLDGEQWQELEGTADAANTVTFELSVLLDGAGGNLNFADNCGFLYLRIGDKSPEDGMMGGDLFEAKLTYQCESGNTLIGFVPNTEAEKTYLADDYLSELWGSGTPDDPFCRFADGNKPSDDQNIGAYWIYEFKSDAGIGLFYTELALNNDRVVEYSLDSGEWIQLHTGSGERTQGFAFDANGATSVRLRFSDSTKDSGFGVKLSNIGVIYAPAGE